MINNLTKTLIKIKSYLDCGLSLNHSILKSTKGTVLFSEAYNFIIQELIEKHDMDLVITADNKLSSSQKIQLLEYLIKKSELILFT